MRRTAKGCAFFALEGLREAFLKDLEGLIATTGEFMAVAPCRCSREHGFLSRHSNPLRCPVMSSRFLRLGAPQPDEWLQYANANRGQNIATFSIC